MSSQLPLFSVPQTSPSWSVRVSRRARRLSVRVHPGGRVEVVVPPGVAAGTVQRFVSSHSEWIADRVRDMSRPEVCPDTRRPQRIELPAIERAYEVEYHPTQAAGVTVQQLGGVLRCRGRVEDDARVANALRRWLIATAELEFASWLRRVSQELQLPFARVQVRRQRSRWGSCSASGTISLNVCLLFMAPDVVRYLFVHELSHTRHMNHSARFWALVARHEPQYQHLDAALTQGWQQVPGWVFA